METTGVPLSGVHADPLVGQLLDARYRLDQAVARGGMATVYMATDTRLDRVVAVKVMRPALANGPAPLIDDDLANVGPWGFEPAQVAGPVLFLHGESDRLIPAAHSAWLAERCPARAAAGHCG